MKLPSFEEDKRRVDRFEDEIKAICGHTFIGTASKEIDCNEATDLLVLDVKPVRIACRVRRYNYYLSYPDEFTIRSSRPTTGAVTELTKILQGWCEYYFYGFADEADRSLLRWFIGDLKVFRYEYLNYAARKPGCIAASRQTNGDGSANFLAFKLSSFPQKFIIATNNGHRGTI